MNRWNPNFYLKEGRSKGFSEEYLQRLVATGRNIQLSNIPVVFSLSHLANLSQTCYSDLHLFVSRQTAGQKDFPYRNFTIRKRSGGRRWISIPVPPLMAVQSWIAKNILNNVQPHRAAYAYVIGRRAKDHAKNHCASNWLLKIDIKDFFNNISERQVYQIFTSLGYPKLMSFEMARLCTRVTPGRTGKRWNVAWGDFQVDDYTSRLIGSLPQGAPTSPALSNLVCSGMDTQLEKLANEYGGTYSRYADDLCFSLMDSSRDDLLRLKKEVSSVLWNNSFTENRKKTQIIPPGARKVVTGLIVNGGSPTIPKEVRDSVRMHLYYCKKLGIPRHCERQRFRSVIGFRNYLYGLIMYVRSINPIQGESFFNQYSELPWINFEI